MFSDWNGSHNNNSSSDEGGNNQNAPLWLIILVYINYALFITAYIIPNVFLIVIFVKREFYQQNLFYTIVHWSFANLLHVIFAIYILYFFEKYRGEKLTIAFLAVHCSISGIPLNMAICWIFDKFIKSKKFCFKSIRNNWILMIGQIAILLALVFTDIFDGSNIAIGYIAFSTATLIIFLSRLIRFWCKGSEEENYHLRAWMSGIFIFTSYLFTIWLVIEIILGIHISGLISIALNVVLINGYVNLILLYIYDEHFNTIVKVLKQKFRKRFGKKKTAVVTEVDVGIVEVPSKSESEYELSTHHDEVSVIYEGIDQTGTNIGERRCNGNRNVSTA